MTRPAQPNQSLISGIACLQLLVSAERPLGSRELARLLGEDHTRVNRLLGTLAAVGLAEQAPDRKYRPGPGVHVLAAQSLHGSALLSCALPHLRALRGERDSRGEGLTVALGVLWNLRVSFLVHARPGQPLEEAIGSHEAHPFDNSSIGIVLAAHQHAGPAAPAPLPAGASPDLLDRLERLRPALDDVRLGGVARLTFGGGIVSLGVPVGVPVAPPAGPSGAPPVAALAASGRLERADEGRVIRALRAAAERIAGDTLLQPVPAGGLPRAATPMVGTAADPTDLGALK